MSVKEVSICVTIAHDVWFIVKYMATGDREYLFLLIMIPQYDFQVLPPPKDVSGGNKSAILDDVLGGEPVNKKDVRIVSQYVKSMTSILSFQKEDEDERIGTVTINNITGLPNEENKNKNKAKMNQTLKKRVKVWQNFIIFEFRLIFCQIQMMKLLASNAINNIFSPGLIISIFPSSSVQLFLFYMQAREQALTYLEDVNITTYAEVKAVGDALESVTSEPSELSADALVRIFLHRRCCDKNFSAPHMLWSVSPPPMLW